MQRAELRALLDQRSPASAPREVQDLWEVEWEKLEAGGPGSPEVARQFFHWLAGWSLQVTQPVWTTVSTSMKGGRIVNLKNDLKVPMWL